MKTLRVSLVVAALSGLCLAQGAVLFAEAGQAPEPAGSLPLRQGGSPRSQVELSIGLAVSLPALPYGDFTTYVGPVVGVVWPLRRSFAIGAWGCGALCLKAPLSLEVSAGPTLILGNPRTFGVSISPGPGLFFIQGYPMFFLDVRAGLYYRGFFIHLAWVAWLGAGVKVDAGYSFRL